MIRGMVERLAERLRDEPDDAAGWRRLARAYEVLGEADKARDALAHAEAAEKKANP
jgi:cytochrome c-type biogenesis protein CcmH